MTWNGTRTAGTAVPDGTYGVVLSVKDARGNTVEQTASVIVNRVLGFLYTSPNRFYPQDGDTYARTTTIRYRLASAATSTLRVLNAAGAVVRTAWYARHTPAGTYTWTWDGRNAAGAMVPQGDYTVQVIATGTAGRAFLARPLTVAAYMVRTTLSGETPGLSYTVNAWASEPMRTTPSITLVAAGQTLAGTVSVPGTGHYQATFSGPTLVGPGTVTISGLDAGGRIDSLQLPRLLRGHPAGAQPVAVAERAGIAQPVAGRPLSPGQSPSAVPSRLVRRPTEPVGLARPVAVGRRVPRHDHRHVPLDPGAHGPQLDRRGGDDGRHGRHGHGRRGRGGQLVHRPRASRSAPTSRGTC